METERQIVARLDEYGANITSRHQRGLSKNYQQHRIKHTRRVRMEKQFTSIAWAVGSESLEGIYTTDNGAVAPYGLYCNVSDMTDMGWIRIGTATIHLDLIDPKDTMAAQVESLQAQITKTIADSEATLTMLRSKINDLLAIENSGGEK